MVGVRGSRLEHDGAVATLERSLVAPQRTERVAAIAPGVGVARLQHNRPVITLERRLIVLKSVQHAAAVVVGLGIVRIRLNRLVDQLQREFASSHLKRDQAEKMQRARMAGRDLQYLAIERFRLGKLSGLVMSDRLLQ